MHSRSFQLQGSCYSEIDLCKPRLVGVHHGPRPTAHDRQKNFLHLTESVIRCEVRFGYCTTNQAPLAELIAEADETMFENILAVNNMCSINCCRTERN